MRRNSTLWLDQTEHLVKIWTESDHKMWESWFERMGTTSPSDWSATDRSEVEDVEEQRSDNQEVFLRFLTLSTKAWKEIAPLAASGADWQAVLNHYTAQLRKQQFWFPQENAQAVQDAGELWQLYLQSLQKFSWLGSAFWQGLLETLNKASLGDHLAWLELSDLYWNIYEKTFGGFCLSPSLGYTREFNNKLLKGFDTWMEFYKASFDYQVVLANTRVRAFEELMGELVSCQEKGEKVESWRQFLQIWSRVADRVFAETFRDPKALQRRGKFLNAAMTHRLQEQQLMEVFLKMNNQPVRSEVDEVHRHIYQLGKEIKALKKALAQFPKTRE